jgi:hypothetical protein
MQKMNGTPQPIEYNEISSPIPERIILDMPPDSPGSLIKLPTVDSTAEQWQQRGKLVSQILAELPDYISKFISSNRRPLITVGLILAGFVSLKITLAILTAINELPLLSPTFELIGIGYTIWFVRRYLLQASNREELQQEVKKLTSQIAGKDSQ